MPDSDHLPRREFTWRCVGGLSALAAVPPTASAHDRPPPPPLPEDLPKRQADQLPPVELLILSAIVQSYPSERYTDEILRNIYGDIAADLFRGKQLRAFPLQNGDGPAAVFRASLPPSDEGTP